MCVPVFTNLSVQAAALPDGQSANVKGISGENQYTVHIVLNINHLCIVNPVHVNLKLCIAFHFNVKL